MPRASLPCCLLCAGAVLAFGSPAARAENGLTVYGGWRTSGGLEDATTGRGVSMKETGAVSLALDLDYEESSQIQIFASYQNTSLAVTEAGQPAGTTTRLPLKVAYLHLGGTVFFNGPVSRGGPYIVGGLGISVLSPGLDGLGTETQPSMNLGVGYQLPLGDSLALRFEGRGYFTLVDSSGGFFCSGGCTVSISGQVLSQGELMAGLTWRFK
jgi:hypothetical protein